MLHSVMPVCERGVGGRVGVKWDKRSGDIQGNRKEQEVAGKRVSQVYKSSIKKKDRPGLW